jgi:IS5 family transposase
MNSFDTYLLRRIYKKIAKLGDKLAEADAQIDWTTLRPIIQGLYTNDTERGGRPNADEVVTGMLRGTPRIFMGKSP